MKTNLQLIAYIILNIVSFSYAQNEGEIDFADQIEATGETNSYGLNILTKISAVDNDGYLYYGSTFNDSIVLGNSIYLCTNEKDGIFCKSDTNNIILWAKHIKCTQRMTFNTFYDKDEGLLFLYGSFYGQIVFDDDTLTSIGWSDMFIAKLDLEGNYVQLIQTGGVWEDNILCLTKDIEGNIVIGGYYYKSTTIGDSTFESPSGYGNETFTAKMDYGLDFIWVVNGTGPNNDKIYKCVSDQDANIYITGNTFEGISFDTITLNQAHKVAFIAKISKDGEYLWAKQYGGDSEDCWVFVLDMVADKTGNFIVAGQFKEKLILDTCIFQCNGLFDLYLFSFDTNGTLNWAKQYGGKEEDVSVDLYRGEGNNIYFIGLFMNEIDLGITTLKSSGLVDSFISELNKENGDFIWGFNIGGTNDITSRAFCSSIYKRNLTLYLGGVFEEDIILGNYHFFSKTSFDGFVARFKILTTSIESSPLPNKSISVFPNPAKGHINVRYYMSIAGSTTIYLTDLHGRILKSFGSIWSPSGQHKTTLDLSGNPSGVYYIKTVSASGVDAEKIIISK